MAVAIAGGFVLWANLGADTPAKWESGLGSVQKAPLAGGDAVPVAVKLDSPMFIAADNTHVYWVGPLAVRRAPLGGGPASLVALLGEGLPRALAVDSEFAIVGITHMTNGGLFKAPKDGSRVELMKVNGGFWAEAVATDGEATYFCVNGDVLARIPKGGSAKNASILGKGLQGCAGVAVEQDAVYYTEEAAGTLSRVAKTGGEPTVLARDLGEPHEVVIDGENVYWLEWKSGRVARVDRKGGRTSTLVSGLKDPRGLAVAHGIVAWCNPDEGTVSKVVVDAEATTRPVTPTTASAGSAFSIPAVASAIPAATSTSPLEAVTTDCLPCQTQEDFDVAWSKHSRCCETHACKVDSECPTGRVCCRIPKGELCADAERCTPRNRVDP